MSSECAVRGTRSSRTCICKALDGKNDVAPNFRDLLEDAIEEDSANIGQLSMGVKLDFNKEPS